MHIVTDELITQTNEAQSNMRGHIRTHGINNSIEAAVMKWAEDGHDQATLRGILKAVYEAGQAAMI